MRDNGSKSELCEELLDVILKICSTLDAESQNAFKSKRMEKAINIAAHCDISGFAKIRRLLDDESRVLYDNRVWSSELESLFTSAYEISEKLNS